MEARETRLFGPQRDGCGAGAPRGPAGRVAARAGRRRPGRRAAGARRPGLGGAGPATPAGCPSCRALDGRADHHRGAVDHARRAHVDHHRAPAGRHGITGFRIRVTTAGVLNAIRWQLGDGGRPPDPATCRRHAPFRGRTVPVVTKASSAPPGSPACTSAAPTSTAGTTTSVLVEHVRGARRRRRAVRVRVLPGRRRGRARVRPRGARSTRPSSRPPTGWSATSSTRCPTTSRCWSPPTTARCRPRARGWLGLGRCSTAWSRPTPATAGSATCTRGRARAAELLVAAEEHPRRRRVGLPARAAARRGVARARTRCRPARRRVGDVVLAARDAVGFVDPTLPYEAQPASAPRLDHRGRGARSRLVASAGRSGSSDDACKRRANYSRCDSSTAPVDARSCAQWPGDAAVEGSRRRVGQVVRPSPPAHRVLDARRCGADRRRGGDGRGRRPARGRHHRPREHVRRPRLLPRRARRRPHAGHRHGGLHSPRAALRPPAVATEHEIFHLTLLAETNAGLPQPHQGHVARVPRRLLLQAPRRLGAARAAPRGAHRHDAAASAARCRSAILAGDYARRARARRRASRRSSGATRSSSSCRTTACPSSAASTRSCIEIAREHAGAAARDQRQPLHAPRRRRGARRAAVRADRRAQVDDPKRFKFDGDEFYLKTAAEMRDAVRRLRGGVRQHAARSPSAPTSRSSSATRSCRRSRCRRATTRTRTSASSRIEGAQGALRRVARAARCSSASSTSSASSSRWGSPRTSSSCGTSCATRSHAASASGPGRGSAAGSCVAYCLRIVDIDPIKYDLLFERFLNPGRKQMPDIDMDFDSRYRGEMIKYAAERYGVRPRRADHHVLDDQGAGRGARRGTRARLPVRRRRQDRQAHAAARSWAATRRCTRASRRSTRLRRRLQDGRPSCATLYEADPDAQARHRRRARARGPAPPGRHPRRRGGHHPRAAHRVPADPAQAGGRAADRGRADRHAVRDARRRGPRAAQDGLPRPAQPRRHRDRARPHRASPPASRPDIDRVAARRPQDVRAAAARATRSACSSSKAGRCARCCARSRPRRSRTSPRSSRCTGPGRWRRTGTTSTPTARTAASRSTYPTPTSRRSSRPPTG